MLDDLDLPGEAVDGDLLHVVEHVVNVDRLALNRTLVAEDLHAVDELADAVGFRADQLRQGAVGIGALAFEQLRRTPDAGERVLDLMREHGREPGHRARRAAMGELALDHLRHAALLEQDQHVTRRFGERPAVEIDELRAIEAERAEVDAVFVDMGVLPLHLLDEREEWAAEGDHLAERVAGEHGRAHLEEILGGVVGIGDAEIRADDQERMRQRAEQRFRWKSSAVGRAGACVCFLFVALKRYILAEPPRPGPVMHNYYATSSPDILLCRIKWNLRGSNMTIAAVQKTFRNRCLTARRRPGMSVAALIVAAGRGVRAAGQNTLIAKQYLLASRRADAGADDRRFRPP